MRARSPRPATKTDVAFMRQALRLARRGLGRTSPNPPVGAVVVRRGKVVGRGYHRRAGAAHGEAAALADAGKLAKGGTLYVTLEPCAHHGRTPPCVDAVRAAGVRRVVIGCRDPNPRVRGGGAQRLRRAGLEVVVGVLEAECGELIQAFRKTVTTGIPWVTLKLAATLDGRIATATGDSRWVTGEPARRLVHRWRNLHDAVLVGAETVRLDDPELTCRLAGGRDPLRVILDGRLRISPSARVLQPPLAAGTLIVSARNAPAKARVAVARHGTAVITLPDRGGRVSVRDALTALAARGISSVLAEGGGEVAAQMMREGVVDELLLFYAPKLAGGDGRPMFASLGVLAMGDAFPVDIVARRLVGADLLVIARPGRTGVTRCEPWRPSITRRQRHS